VRIFLYNQVVDAPLKKHNEHKKHPFMHDSVISQPLFPDLVRLVRTFLQVQQQPGDF
jgi:hypothetical protein